MNHKIQIDDTVRDATPAEIAAIEAAQAVPTLEEHIAARQTNIESARAKLKELGLTDDEIATITGA